MSEKNLRLRYRRYRLENIDKCWDYINENDLESFIHNFSNETLSKVYRLIIFSSELPKSNIYTFYHNVQVSIEDEAQKRKFDCFSPHVKDNKSEIFDVIYVDKKIVLID